jgi:hypothetical protein
MIAADGSDEDSNPAKRPIQVTHLSAGAGPGLRWHRSGDWIVCTSNGGIVATCVKPGAGFGESVFLTSQGDGLAHHDLVLSLDGKWIAFGRAVPTKDQAGRPVKTYNGQDPVQIFILPFPDNLLPRAK